MLVKHCPECQEDYMPHVDVCADCGAALVTRDDEAVPAGDVAPSLPPGDYRPLLHVDRVAGLDPLVARLAAAQVPARVDVSARGQGFDLKVREEERERALELLGDVLGDVAADEAALSRHFDAERGGYAACPACESALPAGAAECPECGLLLAGEAPACAHCGADVDADAASCTACGERRQ